ncbi:MAG: ABC transporter ATP-binding protein [Bacilli bacterium]|nr:ABC transporter ATP-binding protein [Bacilli bacterium]
MAEKLLEIKNLKKYYGKGDSQVKALDDISFDVFKGEMLVLLGNSGCGKSTLLNIIGGMDSPTEGKVLLNGVDITSFKDKELTKYRKEKIGFIFQFYNLLPDLTALENVKMSLNKKDEEHLSEKTLELVGLGDNKMKQYPSQMSGGEQQRVSIARALVKGASIILCDEPTGALDDKTGRKILELLQDIVRKEGQTMIIVTHTKEIASMADRIITLRNGKIEKQEINEHPLDAKDINW